MGLAGQAIQLADPLLRGLAAENRNYTYAQGSTVSGLGHTGDVYGNNMASTMFFGGERQKALQTALEKMGKTQFADKYTLGVGGLLGKTVAGAGAGATALGIAGSIVPGLGNVVGAGAGAIGSGVWLAGLMAT
jgi:hypothetical protein